MVTLFNDISVFHDKDQIRIFDRRQSVGYNKARSAFHQTCKGTLDLQLCSCINGRGCFIQDQHRRKCQHDTGNTQKLLLSLRKHTTVFSDHRIIPLWHTADKRISIGCLCRFYHFLISCLRLTHFDIIADRTGFQPCFLQYHTIGRTQALSCHITDICLIDADLTAVYIIKTHQQVDDRCLTTTCRPYDRNILSRLYLKVEILNQLLLRCVGEIYMFCRYIALCIRQHICIFRIRDLGRLLDQFKNPARTGNGILQLRNDCGYIVKRLCILIRVA